AGRPSLGPAPPGRPRREPGRPRPAPRIDAIIRKTNTMGRLSTAQPAKATATTAPRLSQPRPELPPKEGHRDTVEAIVVSFTLAVAVRGFEAQAFVIPTGSIAPTLMGRHKEVACPQCGFLYAVNASGEVETSIHPNRDVSSGICVNCRYQDLSLHEAPSFKGD